MRRFYFLSLFFLTACSTPGDYKSYLSDKNVAEPAGYSSFQHCHGYGCQRVSDVSLSEADWQDIEALFTPPSATAAEERARISQAIGLFEIKVGAIDGTDKDVHGTFYKLGVGQLDCVDESTNTTVYLSLLQQYGLMTFHDISRPDTRIPLVHYIGRWPHQSAVIFEKQSGTPYAVDSWFHDNGHKAEIVPLEQWKAGWRPDKSS